MLKGLASKSSAAKNRDYDEPWQSRTSLFPSKIPNDGVGLARMEFIVNSYIKFILLLSFIPEKITDEAERRQLDDLLRLSR